MIEDLELFFFDNFYTSFRVARDLLERKTFCCGTVRTDRGLFPAKFKMKNSKEDKKYLSKMVTFLLSTGKTTEMFSLCLLAM